MSNMPIYSLLLMCSEFENIYKGYKKTRPDTDSLKRESKFLEIRIYTQLTYFVRKIGPTHATTPFWPKQG